jgi:hypothetical protein
LEPDRICYGRPKLGFHSLFICDRKEVTDKAKPSARVGRKATGLGGKAQKLARFGIIDFLDSRVAGPIESEAILWGRGAWVARLFRWRKDTNNTTLDQYGMGTLRPRRQEEV